MEISVKLQDGSVLVRVMFSGTRVGRFIWLRGKINALVHANIIELHVVHYLRSSSATGLIFMHLILQ